MLIIPEPIEFEWDKGNTNKNLKKHKVTDKEAEEPFDNEPIFIKKDIKHSVIEKPYHALGTTDDGRLLFLSFTIRKNRVRIISARDMNYKERRIYEKIKNDSAI